MSSPILLFKNLASTPNSVSVEVNGFKLGLGKLSPEEYCPSGRFKCELPAPYNRVVLYGPTELTFPTWAQDILAFPNEIHFGIVFQASENTKLPPMEGYAILLASGFKTENQSFLTVPVTNK